MGSSQDSSAKWADMSALTGQADYIWIVVITSTLVNMICGFTEEEKLDILLERDLGHKTGIKGKLFLNLSYLTKIK